MTTCEQCGSEIELVDSEGGVKSGQFTEYYTCTHCPADGMISGDASDPPSQWSKTGTLF